MNTNQTAEGSNVSGVAVGDVDVMDFARGVDGDSSMAGIASGF